MMLNLYTGTINVKIEENFPDMKFLNNFFLQSLEEFILETILHVLKLYLFSSERSKYWKTSLFQIMHPGIENYFEGFDGAQYIPRPWLKAVFPHDWPWPLVISPWHFLIFLTFVKKKCIYGYFKRDDVHVDFNSLFFLNCCGCLVTF